MIKKKRLNNRLMINDYRAAQLIKNVEYHHRLNSSVAFIYSFVSFLHKQLPI